MGVIRSIRNVRHLAARLLAAHAATFDRPQFALPAGAALAAALALLFAPAPFAFFFAPALLLGCRCYELARFRAVRASRWLLLLLVVAAGASLLWSFGHPSGGPAMLLELALAVGALVAGYQLWSTQIRLQATENARSWRTPLDEEDDLPRWACGGMLALMPVLFLLGLVSSLCSWQNPATILWGLAGAVLLAMQLRTDRWFPRLAIAWLLVWLAIETAEALTAAEDPDDGTFIAYAAVSLLVASMCSYLERSARVRRTFRPAPRGPSPWLPATTGGTPPIASVRDASGDERSVPA